MCRSHIQVLSVIKRKKMNRYLIILLSAIILSACNSNTDDKDSEDKRVNRENAKIAFFENVFNENNLISQTFEINPNRDTLITGNKGTKLRIYANTFDGVSDSSETIVIELKEVFSKQDFIIGNLTTLSDNALLESGGMIFINATSNGNLLNINSDKEIGIIVPTTLVDEEMNIYNGIKNDSSINWVNPDIVQNSKVKNMEQTYKTVWYYPRSSSNPDELVQDEDWKEEDIIKRDNWFWESGRKIGDTLYFDKYFVHIVNYTLDKVKLSESGNGVFLQEVITEKGTSGYIEDYNTNYIFAVKKLGWSNIDKLFNDPKAEEINLIVKVDNASEFDYVFTSLVFDDREIYVPGYQRKDDTYGFTHNDSERLILPINDNVTLLTTAYKGDQPYFALTKFSLKPTQTISCKLEQKTLKSIKKELDEKI